MVVAFITDISVSVLGEGHAPEAGLAASEDKGAGAASGQRWRAAQRSAQAGKRGEAHQDKADWAEAVLEAQTMLGTRGLGWPRAKSGAPA